MFSWLLIPAAIGAVVALVLEVQIREARPLTKHQADERIKALEVELKRLQEERQGEADGSPGHA